jgi:pilus assembly protein CpaF
VGTVRHEEEQALIGEIKQYALDSLPLSQLSDEALEEEIERAVVEKIGTRYCSIESRLSIVQQVYSSIRGFGLLDSIISDDSITEVMINGHENVLIEKNGRLMKLDRQFETQRRLEDVIQRIVGLAGREVNQASPIVDTRLPDGSRVNVVLPPISLSGPVITIRKFTKTPMTIDMLIRYGSITREIAERLEILVKAKYNIFISGGTGSGKTTFLNALSDFIPKDERIITIEDSAELQIKGIDNIVSLETRNANAAGAGQVTIRDLIRSSLRMRPERIVVGEVRGGEALDMLQAMNTGHDGSLSTGHANSTRDMLSRLETMVLQGAAGLPLDAIRQQIASAVDIIIHLSRLRDHSRKTMEITEVLDYKDGAIQLNPLYVFEEDEHSTLDKVSGSLRRTENPFVRDFKLRLAGAKIIFYRGLHLQPTTQILVLCCRKTATKY